MAPSAALLHVAERRHNGWTGGKSSRSKKDIADSSSRSAKSLWRLDGQKGGNGVLVVGVDDDDEDDDDEVAEPPQLLLLLMARWLMGDREWEVGRVVGGRVVASARGATSSPVLGAHAHGGGGK